MNTTSPNNSAQQVQREANPQATRQRVSFKKQNAIIAPDVSLYSFEESLPSSTETPQPSMTDTQNHLTTPTIHQQTTLANPMARGSRKNSKLSLSNLHVPHSTARKMSLQSSSQQQASNDHHLNYATSNPTLNTSTSSLLFSNNNSVGTTNNNNTSLANKNSLSVNSQNLMPRKSLIGSRLEKSSLQAQRLSDVGLAVGQQLTAKIGLKLPASQERIVEQTRWLYLRYVLHKLHQNSLPLKDLNLTKSSIIRRNMNSHSESLVPEITCSAPVLGSDHSETFSEFTPLESQLYRKQRSRMSQGITTQDINIFAARMKSLTPVPSQDLDSSCSSDIIVNLTSSIDSIDENTFFKSNRTHSLEKQAKYNNHHHLIKRRNNFTAGPAMNRKYILDTTINNQIFIVILNMICDLRELKPEYYGDTIYEVVGIDKFSSLENLLDVQMRICQEMTRTEITWCRIAALFSLFGAMSLDCVRLGAPEHVGPILEGFMGFVERDLALWISQQGGWESFLYKHKASFKMSYLTPALILAIIVPIFAWGLMDLFS